MIIELDLQPEIEQGLLTRAASRGLSLRDYVNEIVVREVTVALQSLRPRSGQDLIDACAKVRGLLTNEEVDTLFVRDSSLSRPVDLG